MAAARAGEPISVNGFNVSGAYLDGLLAADVPAAAAALSIPMLVMTGGAPPARLAAHPRVEVERMPIVPFWKEPKVHVAGVPVFLAKTIEWLMPRQQGLREVS
jgi:hypothetical protein